MPQKNATPNKQQAAIIKRHGLEPLRWVVIRDLSCSLIIKHRDNDEFKVIEKCVT